jgi:hypothetical protein
MIEVTKSGEVVEVETCTVRLFTWTALLQIPLRLMMQNQPDLRSMKRRREHAKAASLLSECMEPLTRAVDELIQDCEHPKEVGLTPTEALIRFGHRLGIKNLPDLPQS